MFEYLIEKINEVQSYDDIVVLGTLGVLMHTKNILSNKEVVNEIQKEIDKLSEGSEPGKQTGEPTSNTPVGQTGEEGTGEEGTGKGPQERQEYPQWDENSDTLKMLQSVMTDLQAENADLNDIQKKLDQLESQNNPQLVEILKKLTTFVQEKQSAKEFGHKLEKQKKKGGAETFEKEELEKILTFGDGDYNIFTDVVQQFFKNDLADIPETTFHFTKFDIPFDRKNWQQDFVNLAQVFYETEFCPDTFTSINQEDDLDDDLGLFVMEVNDVLKNRTDIKKSVSLVYYKKKLLLSEEKKYSNLRNVEFKYFNDEKKLKKNIKIPREMDHIKQQIVVLDEPTFTGVQEIVDKSNVDTVIIVVGDENPKLTDNDKEHIRWIRVEASLSSKKKNRVTYSGCADKEYFFQENYGNNTVETASIEYAILQNLVLCIFDVIPEGFDGFDEEGFDFSNVEGMNESNVEGMNESNVEGMNESNVEGMNESNVEGVKSLNVGPQESNVGEGKGSNIQGAEELNVEGLDLSNVGPQIGEGEESNVGGINDSNVGPNDSNVGPNDSNVGPHISNVQGAESSNDSNKSTPRMETKSPKKKPKRITIRRKTP